MNYFAAGSIKLTSFSRGGGCGCKIAPDILGKILSGYSSKFPIPKELMVGIETSDDAAVYRLNDNQALIATTDFFTAIVDDPYDFGRISATNAISDVYAMGGIPIMALALVGMPIDKLPLEVVNKVLRGGEFICKEAGIPIAGGHTIDSIEPIYGLVVLGLIHPSQLKRNTGAKLGDKIVLGKPIGTGILSAALRNNLLDSDSYKIFIKNATMLNKPGCLLSKLVGVNSMTDVTGFGLLGHALELAHPGNLSVKLKMSSIPLLPKVEALAKMGCVTGASIRNWNCYKANITLDENVTLVQRNLLTDPQTSGGLLVACDSSGAEEVLRIFHNQDFFDATIIGEVIEGNGRVEVVHSNTSEEQD